MSSPKYRPDIDGLRAVAVLSVLFFHAFPSSIKGGFIGVDIFFIISGFLISSIIFREVEEGRFTLWQFYVRRVRLPYNIKGCFTRPLKPEAKSCQLDISARHIQDQKLEMLKKGVQEKHPQVVFFEQNDFFCDSEKCSMVDPENGLPYLRDEYLHLSVHASEKTVKLFSERFKTLLPDLIQ